MKRHLTWLCLIAVAATSFPASALAQANVWDRLQEAARNQRQREREYQRNELERRRQYYDNLRDSTRQPYDTVRNTAQFESERPIPPPPPLPVPPVRVPATGEPRRLYVSSTRVPQDNFASVHEGVLVLADDMADELRRIHPVVAYDAPLENEVREVIGSIETLFQWAETGRPVSDIQAQFAVLDEKWHPLSHRLAARSDLATWIPQSVATAQQADDRLHALLGVPASGAYNPPRLAELSRALKDATANLQREVREELRDRDIDPETARAMTHVARQAAHFDHAVASGAQFAVAVEEFNEFDNAWHSLVERGRADRDFDRHLKRAAQRVWELDRELHQELMVDAPSYSDRESFRNIASRIGQTADHFVKDVTFEVQGHRRAVEIVSWANLFGRNMAQLNRQLAQESNPRGASEAFAVVLRTWQTLHQLLQDLDRGQFEHTIRMANEINEDLHRLQQAGL